MRVLPSIFRVMAGCLFAAGAPAAPLDEAREKLQAEIESASENTKLSPAQQEALRALGIGVLDDRLESAGHLRWMPAQTGAALPESVRASAEAFVAAQGREIEVQAGALETKASRIFEQVWMAHDAPKLESLLGEIDAASTDAGLAGMNPRGRAALDALQRGRQVARQWLEILNSQSGGDRIKALGALASLHSQTDALPPGSSANASERIRETVRALGIPAAEDAGKEIGALIAQIVAAASAREIDPLLATLRERQELWMAARDLAPPGGIALAERAGRFARSWQEYVAARAGGDDARAQKVIESLVREDPGVPGISRSMLLERAMAEPDTAAVRESPASFDQLLLSCKTLAQLEKSLPELEEAARNSRFGNARAGVAYSTAFAAALRILPELHALDREYQDTKASPNPALPNARSGLPPLPNHASRRSSSIADSGWRADGGAGLPGVVRALRQELLVLVLARRFGQPSQPGDTPQAFLRRRFLAAREEQAWPAVKRVLETAHALGSRDQICVPADAEALTQYLAGLNYAEAGVIPLAVSSFLSALKTGSVILPLDDIKIRLAKFRAEHAADYAEGFAQMNRDETSRSSEERN